MKYIRIDKLTGKREEITYEKALSILLGCYRDNDMTRDWLTVLNYIPCNYSDVEVVGDNGEQLFRPIQTVTIGYQYDENGNRIK